MAVLEGLEPKKVFYYFEELCKIPHGTFHTKEISDYCASFARERGLEVFQDEADNVVIKKSGTVGYEDAEPVILQGHLDMVCEKRPGSSHDFDTQGLDLYIEDGYVKAKDTTLGGDNGIAVAMIMAILDSKDIAHPPIEAVFTSEEEAGMSGALALDFSLLKSRKLINIDSEEEGILTVSCAGGYRFNAKIPIEKTIKSGVPAIIRIHGLMGGHSGADIHKQRGNANKMMARLLNHIRREINFNLVEICGGTLDNVIPLEATAIVLIAENDCQRMKEIINEMAAVWMTEFMGEEPGLSVDVSFNELTEQEVCTDESTVRVITYLYTSPDGVQAYDRKLPGLVETSLNLGIVETKDTYIRAGHLVRSSVESKKQELKERMGAIAASANAECESGNEYPAWSYKEDSKLRTIMVDTYKSLFNKEPEVSSIHAGLECGLFVGKCPDLDCVSFGPNLWDVHSFNERLDIASTERTYEYLKEILRRCK